jgi:hypothetical protein
MASQLTNRSSLVASVGGAIFWYRAQSLIYPAIMFIKTQKGKKRRPKVTICKAIAILCHYGSYWNQTA